MSISELDMKVAGPKSRRDHSGDRFGPEGEAAAGYQTLFSSEAMSCLRRCGDSG